jgi:hypothetical protein
MRTYVQPSQPSRFHAVWATHKGNEALPFVENPGLDLYEEKRRVRPGIDPHFMKGALTAELPSQFVEESSTPTEPTRYLRGTDRTHEARLFTY